MPDILQDFPINAPASRIFEAVSTPEGLDSWWTKTSAGEAVDGAEFQLGFGPEYSWLARVTRCVPDAEFELELVRSDGDWDGTRIGFRLEPGDGATQVRFHHTGWPKANEHYRISCHCWAMYLRVLRRYLEHGEEVPYEDRLDA